MKKQRFHIKRIKIIKQNYTNYRKYYKKNYSKIIELLKNKNIEILTIKRLITFKYSIYLLKELTIKKLRLDFASTISLEDYEMFLEIDSLEEIY